MTAWPCIECGGRGDVSVRPDDCDHAGLNCPCDSADEQCARCGGTRVEPCDHCGEPSAGRDAVTEQPVCEKCDRREGGPLGGMGFQIDYAYEGRS